MPVSKYRGVEEMPEVSQQFGDRSLGGRLRFVVGTFRFARLAPLPRGVRKFHSIEELASDRDRIRSITQI
jgi:hypothetical protein